MLRLITSDRFLNRKSTPLVTIKLKLRLSPGFSMIDQTLKAWVRMSVEHYASN